MNKKAFYISAVIIFLIAACDNERKFDKVIDQIFLGYSFNMTEADFNRYSQTLSDKGLLVKKGEELSYKLKTEFYEYDCEIAMPLFDNYTKKLFHFDLKFSLTNQFESLLEARNDIKEMLTEKYNPKWYRFTNDATGFFGSAENIQLYLTLDSVGNKINLSYANIKDLDKSIKMGDSLRMVDQKKEETDRQIKKKKAVEIF